MTFKYTTIQLKNVTTAYFIKLKFKTKNKKELLSFENKKRGNLKFFKRMPLTREKNGGII